MNPKIFILVAVIGLAATLGIILLFGSSFVNHTSEKDTSQQTSQIQIQPISVELDNISIKEVTEKAAIIDITFKISNPNRSSVIVQVMDYQLFETGFSNDKQVSGGQIGSRPEGMVEFGSDYYTLLGENSIILKDEIVLKNTGNTPELWAALESNTAKWKVSGDVFFNLSSVTSGHENELHFEFEK